MKRTLALAVAAALGLAAPVLAAPVLAAPVLAAPAPAAPALAVASVPAPALWVTTDGDSTVYLFGTIHMLRPGTDWRSPRVEAAFDSASEIWFEVINPDDQAALGPVIQQYGLSPDRPLSSLLTPAEQTAFADAATASGLDAARIDPVRPWFAALMIGMTPLTRAGFDGKAGVETELRARALAAGKPVRGLETIDRQIGGLARMSDEGQLVYLRHTLAHRDTAVAEFERAVEGWRVGDEAAVAAFAHDTGRAISEETHQIFLARRNADWAGQIQTLMQGSGTAFMAVGAAHLSGSDNLIDMLRARGVEVRRL